MIFRINSELVNKDKGSNMLIKQVIKKDESVVYVLKGNIFFTEMIISHNELIDFMSEHNLEYVEKQLGYLD